ncbi:MAG: GNAT family N-acetyltransferase [Phenylobacterium sp.]|uniref:GNAT family N-acetyltransferase n=1 Tax=Phenylobacterium sp. TaxID=1871053 RepID=UPI001A4C9C78|nr:GNAT family N-acetyltransferase [Phenylobacterium sp.]MBL8552727.1 GNAT family N-acetyltransferase [Phenylobacterium sp.]
MPTIALEACEARHKPALEALFQLYTHDFSDFWAGTDRGELGEDGRFPDYPYLDSYWSEPNRWPYLLRVDGHVAGFVLINDFAHSGRPLDFSVAEFFVVRKHRRGGVGRAAARAAIASRPGQWELAVARKNAAAQLFWRGVAAELGAPGTVEERDHDDDLWNGLIVRFMVA